MEGRGLYRRMGITQDLELDCVFVVEIKNLEKNILYLMCPRFGLPDTRNPSWGDIQVEDILQRFSDIPLENIESAIDRIQEAGWAAVNKHRTVLRLTRRGLSEIVSLCYPIPGSHSSSDCD